MSRKRFGLFVFFMTFATVFVTGVWIVSLGIGEKEVPTADVQEELSMTNPGDFVILKSRGLCVVTNVYKGKEGEGNDEVRVIPGLFAGVNQRISIRPRVAFEVEDVREIIRRTGAIDSVWSRHAVEFLGRGY